MLETVSGKSYIVFYLIFWLWRRPENKVTLSMIKQFLFVLSVEAYLVIGLKM